MNISPKTIVTWILVLIVTISSVLVLTGFLNYLPVDVMAEIIKNHFQVVIGLPVSAIFCAFLVVALEQSSGPVKFSGFGFNFEGSAGQVVLWVFCFLAIVVGIKVLW